jgi:hypothetical protein
MKPARIAEHQRPLAGSATPTREGIDVEDRRNLQALEAIAADAHITQRTLAGKLGMALGLTNIYLRRLVRKGYIKCVNVRSNRLRYLLTPTGITEKTRLTYEFMEYSLVLYGQVRTHLRAVLEPCARENRRRVAVYGTGEAAELAYLSLRELGLEPVAIFSQRPGGEFLGIAVRDIAEHMHVAYDLMIVATLESPVELIRQLEGFGVRIEHMVSLRHDFARLAGE